MHGQRDIRTFARPIAVARAGPSRANDRGRELSDAADDSDDEGEEQTR